MSGGEMLEGSEVDLLGDNGVRLHARYKVRVRLDGTSEDFSKKILQR
jgi:hypothetical protein